MGMKLLFDTPVNTPSRHEVILNCSRVSRALGQFQNGVSSAECQLARGLHAVNTFMVSNRERSVLVHRMTPRAYDLTILMR